MKARFSTLDIVAILPELKAKLCTGWRVNQVYDCCDYKTFLFKLNKSIVKMKKDEDPLSVDEEVANKMTFIIESGQRMHSTDYDWPKSHAPSQFASKLRMHIRNKRIEDIRQVGVDRLVDIKFGSNQAANHLIVELYDRGNLILTDYNYSIITILRWRKPSQADKDKDKVVDSKDSENLKIGDIYPLESIRQVGDLEIMSEDKIVELLNDARSILGRNLNYKKRNKLKQSAEDGSVEINLKDLLNPYVIYGSNLLEDRLLAHVFHNDPSIKKCVIKIPLDASGRFDEECVRNYASAIKAALDEAGEILDQVKRREKSPGYLIQQKQDSNMSKKISESKRGIDNVNDNGNKESKSIMTNVDFFPLLSCAQRKIDQESGNLVYVEYESFDKAVDVYYSNLESQKIDSKALGAEKEATKKLGNLKIAQEKRLDELARAQKEDEEKARLIEYNCDKVEDALLIIRSMLANQVPWSDIWATIREAQAAKDPIASLITQVKFNRNEFTMKLNDPYEDSDGDEDGQGEKKKKDKRPKFKIVDIDINLSAHANARRFFVKRRTAVNKEKKTIEVSKKALKNVERQTKERLKEVVVHTNITKARKRYWFENFFWFISSDGYLVVAGREAEQNDLLVKRYMKTNDIYVHADLHGAASVIIKNETSSPVPPKTLVEAGSMAVCYSSAWDSKIATTSWWVYPKQVSKTAPAGEYLSVGAFLIRGKKNFLPLSNLVLGFGFLFRLEEDSIDKRKKERLARELAHRNQVTFVDTTEDPKEEVSTDNEEDVQSDASDELDSGASASGIEEGQSTIKNVKNEVGETDSHGQSENGTATNEQDGNHDDGCGIEGNNDGDDNDDGDDDDVDTRIVEHRLIDTLTESPSNEDVLLYAIPMCGPYSAFSNFKYKVKVVPGANKRGKAAKACHGMFLHDKRASQREKDLLRALKDQDYARNIPNKVKISAANMKSFTKKRPKKSEVRLPM